MTTDEEFGDYVLQELIGGGGMGEVFRAYDTKRRRIVALKRLPSPLSRDEAFQKRFKTESEVAARLSDPHVLPIHSFGEVDGRLYIDMRLVEGSDLAALLAHRGALAPDSAVDLLGQVAQALDAAHRNDLVHRDVKPSNILIADTDEEPGFAYLSDFGVAQLGGADTGLRTTNATAGTVDYMAPERFTSRRVDHRVDVYSLGCVLYEMLTGDKPFRVGSMPEAMHAHIYEAPPRPSSANPAVPAPLDAVVATAMAKDPADRYDTCRELAAAARTAARDTGQAASRPAGDAQPSTVPPGAPAGAGAPTSDGAVAHDTRPSPTPAEPPPTRPAGPAARSRRPRLLVGAAAVVVVLLAGAAATTVTLTRNSAVSTPPAAAAPAGPTAAPPASSAVPAPPPPPPDGTFTGRTSDNKVTVAIATKNGKVAAYLCDGNAVESWMQGAVTGNSVHLQGRSGSSHLDADLDGGSAFGSIIADGSTRPFSAQLNPPPAGLYEARKGAGNRIGWIVLADGEQVGISTTNGTSSPAPALNPSTGSADDDGTPVNAVPVAPAGDWK